MTIGFQGGGLTFDSGSNVFDTFTDKTTWTPTLEFGGGTTGITYSTQSGYYFRINNFAFFFVKIVLTNKGSSSGNMRISGFPLSSAVGSPCYLFATNISFTSGSNIQCQMLGPGAGNPDSLVIHQISSTGTSTVLTDSEFSNTSNVSIQGFTEVS